MRKFLFALVACLACVFPLFAEAHIPPAECVANRDPGYCLWAACETVANHNHISELYSLVESRTHDADVWVDGRLRSRNEGSEDAVVEKFRELGYSHYRMQRAGKAKSTKLIKEACDAGRGCVVGVVWTNKDGVRLSHAIVITDLGDTVVRYIDSNDPSRVYDGTRESFNDRWDGFVLVLD